MIEIRRANERGGANYGWLDTNHTFSFNTYYDKKYMGFRTLRVINEDKVAAGKGFGATRRHGGPTGRSGGNFPKRKIRLDAGSITGWLYGRRVSNPET